MRPLNLDSVLILRIDSDLRAALHGAARSRGTNASALVRAAIAATVRPEDPPPSPPPAAPALRLPVAA